MKRLILSTLLSASLFSAGAQTIGSSTNITGTNNFPVTSTPGNFATNTLFGQTLPKSLVLSGIWSTNEVVIGWFALQHQSSWQLAPGSTNLYVIGWFTNSFINGTNGGSWSTNLPTMYQQVPFPLYFGLNISNFTNQAYMP